MSFLCVGVPRVQPTMIPASPSPKVYTALLSGNVKELAACDQHELRPFLPSLVRMVLSSSTTMSHLSSIKQWEGKRKVVHALISGMIEGNAIQKYLVLDFVVRRVVSGVLCDCYSDVLTSVCSQGWSLCAP